MLFTMFISVVNVQHIENITYEFCACTNKVLSGHCLPGSFHRQDHCTYLSKNFDFVRNYRIKYSLVDTESDMLYVWSTWTVCNNALRIPVLYTVTSGFQSPIIGNLCKY